MSLTINLQFGGGAELLFDKVKKREIQLPPLEKYLQTISEQTGPTIDQNGPTNDQNGPTNDQNGPTNDQNGPTNDQNETNPQKWTIKHLLRWLKDNLLREREELFLQGETVRPGILVLVNDADWELLGELHYELHDRDTVMFISTLHGG